MDAVVLGVKAASAVAHFGDMHLCSRAYLARDFPLTRDSRLMKCFGVRFYSLRRFDLPEELSIQLKRTKGPAVCLAQPKNRRFAGLG